MTGGLITEAGGGESCRLGPNTVTFLLGARDTDGRYALTEFQMAPAPAPGPPLHTHAAEEETIYLLDGDLRVTLGDRVTDVSAGGLAHIPRGLVHTLENIGASAARLLIVQSPAGAERYWAKAAEHLAETHGAPDPERMQQLARDHNIEFLGSRTFGERRP